MGEFSRFFRDHYSLVVSVAERRLGNRSDAEDIATEAFRIAWQHYKGGGELLVPWLYGVVRNLVGDEYRKRGRRARLQEECKERLAFDAPASSGLHADVREAVLSLPETHRDILIMTYWEDLTSKEIASILEINSAAVRARVMRARSLLRTKLAQASELDRVEVQDYERPA